MAYYQEYPHFLDEQLYNNDWLLYQYKNQQADISQLKTDSAQNAANIASLQTLTTSNTARIEALEQGGGGGGEPSDLEPRVKALEDDVADIQADIYAMRTTMSGFTATLMAHTERLDTLESDLTEAENAIIGLQSGKEQTDHDITVLQASVSAQNTAIGALRTDLTKMSATLSGFSATLSSQGNAISDLQSAQTSQDIVNTDFNERITDLENASGGGGETRILLWSWNGEVAQSSNINITLTEDQATTRYKGFILRYIIGPTTQTNTQNRIYRERKIYTNPYATWPVMTDWNDTIWEGYRSFSPGVAQQPMTKTWVRSGATITLYLTQRISLGSTISVGNDNYSIVPVAVYGFFEKNWE